MVGRGISGPRATFWAAGWAQLITVENEEGRLSFFQKLLPLVSEHLTKNKNLATSSKIIFFEKI